jgi:ureidoglycolate amidohydrolase
VRIEADVRDIDQPRRDSVLAGISAACDEVSRRRAVVVRTEIVNADPPAQCGPAVVEALASACDTHGLPYDRMISRAYHDSLFMSRIAPTAMLFIPCRGDVSHRPDEYSSPEAIAQGTLVLAEALASLAR